jgi:O-antigen ligase
LLGVLILAGLYITLFLYSRGAYISILVGLLTISILEKKIFIVPLIVLIMFWQALLPRTVVERINQTQTEEGVLDSSSQRRLELWKESIDLFKNNVFTGVGFNVVAYLGLAGGFQDTHNIYLKVLAEQGIIGMVIFLIFFWLALRSGWCLYRTADDMFLKGLGLGFVACVISTMTSNMFGDRWTYLQLGVYFWVFLALVVKGNMLVMQEASQQQ